MDLRLAKHLAQWSAVAYSTDYPTAQTRGYAVDPFHVRKIIKSSLGKCVVGHMGNDLIFAFRGTNEIRQYLDTNLRVKSDVSEALLVKGRAHNGFLRSAESMIDEVVETIYELRRDRGGIILTGHSKGGAEAILTACGLISRAFPVQGLYTFGCPRVCDGDLTAWLNKRMEDTQYGAWRYSYQSDWVPRLPRRYSHVGRVCWQNGKVWVNKVSWVRRLGAFVFARDWPFIGDSPKDHSIQRYVDAL